MATYSPIDQITELVTTTPGDDEVANKIPASIRQIKGFLATFLAVSFGDTGVLKPTTLITIPAGSVTGGAGGMIASATITALNLGVGCVTTTQILDGTILAGDIASNAIETAKIKNANVTYEKLAPDVLSAITAAVAAGVIADNSITATKLKVISGTTDDPEIPVVAGTGSISSTMAKIGGVLRATLDSGVLLFTFHTGSSTTSATTASFKCDPSGADTQSQEVGPSGWDIVSSDGTLWENQITRTFTCVTAGKYIITFSVGLNNTGFTAIYAGAFKKPVAGSSFVLMATGGQYPANAGYSTGTVPESSFAVGDQVKLYAGATGMNFGTSNITFTKVG